MNKDLGLPLKMLSRSAAWIAVLDACGSGNNSPMGIISVSS